MNEHKEIWRSIVATYHSMIEERYQYDYLIANFDVPESFTKERVDNFRNYFLNFVYPVPEVREQLNESFESLDQFIKKPRKLIRVIMDSSGLVFKHGRFLPSILNAGLNALKSFRIANSFEDKLVANAVLFEMEPPFDKEDVNYLISTLSMTEIEKLISSIESLYSVLYNRPLVKKILEILDELHDKMVNNPSTYSKADIQGIIIGNQIIKQGNTLFEDLSYEEQKLFFSLTVDIERKVLAAIFEEELN